MFPSIHICWGGPHISIFPKETLHLDKVDSIVIGEGEVPFKRLCERLAKGEPLDNIVGVYTRGNEPSSGQFIAYLHQELDDLPILDFNLLLSKKYRTFLTNERLATLVTTKGCPHRCIFCKLDFQKIRFFSIERTIKQIESYLSQGIKRIEFYDETFNINASRVTQFAQEVIKRRLKFKWVFRGRVDAVNSEMLKSVKAAGCQRIQYGIESGSDKILKILKKGITVEQIEKCFLLTNKHEIDTVAYLMLGNPKETMDDIRQTFEFVKKIRPTFIGYSILNIFPGTEVYRMALEAGIIKDDPWRQYAAFPSENLPVLTWTEYFSHSQLEGLRHKALRDYYLRPEYIFRRMLSAKPKELYYMFQRGFRILTNREA